MAKSRQRRPAARWALQDAKNKFSEVVQAAAQGQPQIVTRRGVETAVVISRAEWERITATSNRAPESFAAYLLDIPTVESDGEFERIELRSRDANA